MVMPHSTALAHLKRQIHPKWSRQTGTVFDAATGGLPVTNKVSIDDVTTDWAVLKGITRPSLSDLQPLQLESPDVMNRAELAAWAQVGKNSIQRLVERFAIPEVSGKSSYQRYGTYTVLRQILHVTPETTEEMAELLKPLQLTSWVAGVTGIGRSTLAAYARLQNMDFPPALDLFETCSDQGSSRSRRWIPAQIEAQIRGTSIPFLAQKQSRTKASITPARNVFAAICAANAEGSR